MIEGRRIRSLDRHLAFVPTGAQVAFGVGLDTVPQNALHKIGFSSALQVGDTILPSAIGPVTAYNTHGGYIVHKDRPMETFYMQRVWTWQEWHGRDREEKSKIVDIPRKRYPRTFLPPPSVELTVAAGPNGKSMLITPVFVKQQKSEDDILHAINLLLECFGSCLVLARDLRSIVPGTLRRLNWEILPQGRRPWPALRAAVREVVNEQPEGSRPVIEHRLEFVNRQGAEFVAVGRAGFRGYLVFGFAAKDTYVLESTLPDNATYVLGSTWETLSQLTKAEILGGGLHLARLIHRQGWENQLRQLLARRSSPNHRQ